MFTHQDGDYFEHEGAQLWYERTGKRGAPALVMLHGGLGSLDDFSRMPTWINESFYVLGVDFRGHGKSSRGSRPLTYAQYERDVRALAQHLGISRYSLLGLSDGGIVGLRLAAFESNVEALVTIGAQWRMSKDDPTYDMYAGATADAWAERFPAARSRYTALNPTGNFRSLVTSCVQLWTDLSDSGYPGEAIRTISCPTLIMRGDSDSLLSAAEAINARERISGASFANIPFCGHNVLQRPNSIVDEIVRDFLGNPRTAPQRG